MVGSKTKRTGRKKQRSFLDRLTIGLRWCVLSIVLVVLGSLLWAGAYRFLEPPGTLTMVERHLNGADIRREWVPIDAVSPALLTALIAAEDTRFCTHNGIDLDAIEEALSEAEKGGRLRGASTISQQTAKNAFFWNGGGWARKGGEAWMTVLIEQFWSKKRVLEIYLNVAEWGDGLFGVEAAAQQRFGKSASDLNSYEAALLASVLPNPHKWRIDPPGPYVRKRAGTVRARMRQVRRDGLDACVRD